MAEKGQATARAAAATEAEALARDVADPLAAYRDRFLRPVAPDDSTVIYLAGQSLGLQPRAARAAIEAELAAGAAGWEASTPSPLVLAPSLAIFDEVGYRPCERGRSS